MSKLFADILITASDHSALKAALELVQNKVDSDEILSYSHDDYKVEYELYNQKDLEIFDNTVDSLFDSKTEENGLVNVFETIMDVEGIELNKTMCIACLSEYIQYKNFAADFPHYVRKFIQEYHKILDEEMEEDL